MRETSAAKTHLAAEGLAPAMRWRVKRNPKEESYEAMDPPLCNEMTGRMGAGSRGDRGIDATLFLCGIEQRWHRSNEPWVRSCTPYLIPFHSPLQSWRIQATIETA